MTEPAKAEEKKGFQDGKKSVLTEDEQKLVKEQGPVEGYANIAVEVVESKDEPGEEENVDKGVAEPGKKEEPAKEEKKAEEKPAEEKKDFFDKLETELVKPEGQEDLTNFTPREKAYFFQMRRDRKSRQKAEEDRDAALFREIQSKKKSEEAKPKDEDNPLADLEKRDPTDFMTVEDVKKLVKSLKQEPAKEEAPEAPKPDKARFKMLQLFDNEARSAHPDDYDYVMELVPEIINTNKDYLAKVAQGMRDGENPAEVMYSLIKGDAEAAKLYEAAKTKVDARKTKPSDKKTAEEKPKEEKTPEQIKKEEEAKRAQEAIDKNKSKPKTTGHAETADDHTVEGYSLQQIASMSDREFRQLPKKVRDAYLRKYGA